MRTIQTRIEEMDREYRPLPTRLGMYCERPRKRRTWRSTVLEMVVVCLQIVGVLCAALVAVHVCIGGMQGLFRGLNELCALAMMVVGR